MTAAARRERFDRRGAGAPPDRLRDRLPSVRGRYAENAPLAPFTRFRVGGPAEVLFRPADAEDLADFLAAKPADIPVAVIGAASNLLVRDGGVPGVTVRLGKAFGGIAFGDGVARIGAAAPDLQAARAARRAGRTGLEFLSGIPGTIGGGLRMNAGAYGREFRDALIEAEALDPRGRLRRLPVATMDMGYRRCGVGEDWIFLSALFAAPPGDPAGIARRMAEIRDARARSQPVSERTGGSTFANPPGGKAWKAIEAAGCRGLRVGGAMVSPMHCNFLVNTGAATAADIEALGEEARRRVLENSGIDLRWEIRRIGVPAEEAA